jgi:hypothetical protein
VSVTRLIYASTRTDLSDAAVDAIFEVSLRNNRRDDITGALVVSQNYFVQLLEGPRPSVSQCMVRIAQDSRHTDIEFISTKAVPHRLFAGWSLCRVDTKRLSRSALIPHLVASAFRPEHLTQEAADDLFVAVATAP